MKKFYLLLFLLAFSLFGESLTINNIQKVLAENNFRIENEELEGEIKNLQIAPFDNNLISFEVQVSTQRKKEESYIVLYNLKNKKSFKIASKDYLPKKDTYGQRHFVDQDVAWHPTKNWFLFYGNSYKKRKSLFACKILNSELLNNYAVEVYRLKIEEQARGKRYYRNPCFDKDGNNLYFSRNTYFSRSNKTSYNICRVGNMNSILETKNFEVQCEQVLDDKFDQFHPMPSPVNSSFVAYISFRNTKKRGQRNYYPEYSLNVINVETKEIFVLDKLDGYAKEGYPFKWSNFNMDILYFKAIEIYKTPQDLVNDKLNILDAYAIHFNDKRNYFKPQLLLEDVRALWNGIGFLDQNHALISKYNEIGNGFHLVNTITNESFKVERPLEADYPIVYNNNKICFLNYDYIEASNSYDKSIELGELSYQFDEVKQDIIVEESNLPQQEEKDESIASQTEKSKLEKELKALKAKDEDTDKEIRFLTKNSKDINKNITSYKQELASQEEQIQKLENELAKIKREQKIFTENKDGLLVKKNQKLRELKESLSRVEDEIKEEETIISQLKNELSGTSTELEAKQISIRDLEEELNTLRMNKIDNNKVLNEKIAESELLLNKLADQLKSKIFEIEETESKITEEKNKKSNLMVLLDDLNQEIKMQEDDLKNFRSMKEKETESEAEYVDMEAEDDGENEEETYGQESENTNQTDGDDNYEEYTEDEDNIDLDLEIKDPAAIGSRKKRRR